MFGRLFRAQLMVLAGAFLIIGCGPAEEAMFPVEGKIQVDGKPLAKGTVIFFADGGKGNATKHEPRGTVTDGHYKMLTEQWRLIMDIKSYLP